MTSIAPLRVAGFIEFHVLETEPDIDRTYCMVLLDAQASLSQLPEALLYPRRVLSTLVCW